MRAIFASGLHGWGGESLLRIHKDHAVERLVKVQGLGIRGWGLWFRVQG